MKTYLILDVNNLAWRAWYAIGGLSYKNPEGEMIPTGVLYNVLGTILTLQSRFNTDRCLFAFDSRKSKRKLESKTYKANRTETGRTPEENQALFELFSQISDLKNKYLPTVGFKNLFHQVGYEADDLVASLAQNLPDKSQGIIVSTDKDLLQLLNKRISIWEPRKQMLFTPKVFKNVYGISPDKWADVKAMAGCPSDGVKGIPGVGEKTAIAFINQTLSLTSKKYASIISEEGIKTRRKNLRLVKLPFEGTKVFKIRKDTPNNWVPVLDQLGIKSLSPPSDLEHYKERK